MANFADLVTKIPATGFTRTQGVMVLNNGALAVNVWGSIIPARYADPLVVKNGDTVVVDLMAGAATGQYEAVVSGKLTLNPRPGTATVTVVPASSATISVQGTDGATYTAYFVSSYTPTVNDNVILAWNASVPTVTGKVGTTATPPPVYQPVTPPPGPTSSGTSTYTATDSGTWSSTYGWDNWAGGGGNVFEGGSAYGASNNGAWFYAGSPTELSGRTITRIRFNTGQRRNAGSYNTAVTVNFYAHTASNKPGSDVSRTAGPTGISIAPGFNGTIDLPLSFAGVLQAGGGIAISGEPYTGFNGRYSQPDSGLLQIDWTR